jgi:hypothetical protein
MKPEGLFPYSKDMQLVPILSQMNPVHTTPSYLYKILPEHRTLHNLRCENLKSSFYIYRPKSYTKFKGKIAPVLN